MKLRLTCCFNNDTDDIHTVEPSAFEKLWLLWRRPESGRHGQLFVRHSSPSVWRKCDYFTATEEVGLNKSDQDKYHVPMLTIEIFCRSILTARQLKNNNNQKKNQRHNIRSCAFSQKTQMLNVKGTTSHAQNYLFSPDVCTSREMLSFAITADF